MIPLFIGITAVNLIALGLTLGLGYAVSMGRDASTYHQLAGVLATITCCGVHCVVFTYFIATAKWLQHAISVKHLDPSLADPTRSFKRQAFPAAVLAMAVTFAAAASGTITFSYQISPLWHHVIAWMALLTNGIVAAIEYHAVERNGVLIDDVLRRIGPSQTSATIV